MAAAQSARAAGRALRDRHDLRRARRAGRTAVGVRAAVVPFEIWASPEPTVARIDASTYRDQLAETGHEAREGDIARLASLGVAATRYPVLWEKTAPLDPARPALEWARRRLEALRAAGVEPVVTLLHHGSGPPATSLVDPDFPEKLAAYAGAVAAAFPWVRRWTPINEPLTTARFSTLYGHWYPNLVDDDAAFGQAIVNEALGMLLAMEAIRAHAPAAEFVITEDLQSFTAADPRTEAFVAHKRERMYLSVELAMGRVVPGHALYGYLVDTCRVSAERLARVAAHASAPDVVGWNYYPNSERVLSVDAEGRTLNRARVEVAPGTLSPRPLLRAAAQRLALPFGISEVHVNADERARVRWLLQRYADAAALAEEGLPVRMLGAWAAFGMVDWDSLLRRREGYGEDGIFTFAGPAGEPRETAVAHAVRALARGEDVSLPEEPGWWETQGSPR
ncbi:MAG: family 1 glycosylhydrolase [Candidatus Baltobacteraceae bacterium]